MSEPRIKPWHDTVMHECRPSAWGSGRGPVVPVTQERPHETKAMMHVKCAACGDDWLEDNVTRLVRIWWSKGAWDGERTSYPQGVSDGGACGHGEERDRIVARLREWASVGRVDLYEMALEVERGEHWGKTLSKREAQALGVPPMTGAQMRARILELEGALGELVAWARGGETTGMGAGLHAEMWPPLTPSAKRRMLEIVRGVLPDSAESNRS